MFILMNFIRLLHYSKEGGPMRSTDILEPTLAVRNEKK
jgi:hypothetical protein